MTTMFRRSLCGLLMISVGVLSMSGCDPGKRLGDVDGDDRFAQSDLDALLQILTANSIDPAPPSGPEIADVARPCGGPADEADMRRLRAALALKQAAAAGQPTGGSTVESQCHESGVIGRPKPKPKQEARLDGTLDELFEDVAQQVPGFGGVYVDADTLRVVLEKPDDLPAALAALDDVFGAQLPDLPAQAVPGTFDFRDLMGWRVTARELLYAPDVVSVGVDERANRVRVGLSSMAGLEELQILAANMGLPAGVVVFEEQLRPAEFAFVDELRETQRPLRGGIQIRRGGNCTLGLVARRQGMLGFLTNSHCTATRGVVNGDVFNQATTAMADRVGVEVADAVHWGVGCPGTLCTTADAAFVQIDPLITGERGKVRDEYYWTSSTLTRVVHESLVSFGGQTLRKVGRSTGVSAGEVTETCEDVELVNGVYNFCSYRVDAESAPGDSGSPVLRHVGDTFSDEASFHGLLYAGPVGGGDHFWFAPLGQIEANLGNITAVVGNEPPQLEITNPAHGSSLGTGTLFNVTLEASFFDFEDGPACTGCEVTWTAPYDGGPLGTSTVVNGVATLQVTLSGPGMRWIYATARDSDGGESTDAVLVTTTNGAPVVTIQKPLPNETIQAGFYVLEGTSFDPELFAPLPCTSLQWTSSGIAGGTVTGCNEAVVFPNPGVYTVLLTGTDAQNVQDSDMRSITVVPGPTTGPPSVAFHSPLDGGFGPWHTVELRATGDDPDDESPILYQFVLKAPSWLISPDAPAQDILGTSGGITEVQLAIVFGNDEAHSGSAQWTPATHLRSQCGNQLFVEIEIRAQDADGQQGSAVRQYEYATPPC